MTISIALYEPEIPPNTGNVARLCAATGAALWIVGRPAFSLSDRALKRAGLDYWHEVRLFRAADLDDFFAQVAGRDVWLLSSKATRPYYEARFSTNCVLLFGPETRGLPRELLERMPDRALTIPMPNPVRSLNLSTAVGIVAYEALRQGWTRAAP